MKWDVPWYPGEWVNFIFLVVATAVVLAVPFAYVKYANLHDPLARAVLAGTAVTGLAFAATLATTLAFHRGWNPSPAEENWIARGVYAVVTVGKAMFLIGLLRVVRSSARGDEQSSEQGSDGRTGADQ